MADRVDLDKLEAMEKAATSGPWYHRMETDEERISGKFHDRLMMAGDDDFVVLREVNADHPNFAGRGDEENFEFLAALRNAAPSLISELRRLRRIEEAARERTQRTQLRRNRMSDRLTDEAC